MYFPREYLVDLMCNPGALCSPDSLLNGTSSILVSSPLCHPRFKLVETAEDFRILARLYFFDCQSLNIAFDDPSSGDSPVTYFHIFCNFCKCSDKSFFMRVFYSRIFITSIFIPVCLEIYFYICLKCTISSFLCSWYLSSAIWLFL